MPPPSPALCALQKRIWDGHLPLEIRLATANTKAGRQADPYYIRIPRLGFLPFILEQVHAFYRSSILDTSIPITEAWFDFQDLPLKWHYPAGLLYDLFSGAEHSDGKGQQSKRGTEAEALELPDTIPWKLTLHYTDYPFDHLFQIDDQGKVLLDAFINSVKEADFIRNGSAKTVMGLSKNDSDALWKAVETHDLELFNSVNNKLLNPPGQALRHVPIKVYLPTTSAPAPAIPEGEGEGAEVPPPASVRVIQSLVAPLSPTRTPTTLGTALNEMLPTVFPSKRNPTLAAPVLHGAVVPMNAPVEELGRACSYTDGFLHIVVQLLH